MIGILCTPRIEESALGVFNESRHAGHLSGADEGETETVNVAANHCFETWFIAEGLHRLIIRKPLRCRSEGRLHFEICGLRAASRHNKKERGQEVRRLRLDDGGGGGSRRRPLVWSGLV